jgi:hypothetical protein
MPYSLPLDKKTVEEKIRVMESIWDDLCARADSLRSPSWHQGLLAERESAVERGEDAFEDWDTAKADIRKRVS